MASIFRAILILLISVLWQTSTTRASTGDTISLDSAQFIVSLARQDSGSSSLPLALRTLAIEYLLESQDNEQAVALLAEAIEYASKQEDSLLQYTLATDLGILYSQIGNYNEAINLFAEASDFYATRSDTLKRRVLMNFTGDAFIGGRKIDQALSYIKQVHDFPGNSGTLRRINSNSLTALQRNGAISEGFIRPDTIAIERSPTHTSEDADYSGLIELNAGYFHFQNTDYELADYYLGVTVDTTTDGVILRDALSYLAELHLVNANFQEAYSYMARYASVNDSLLSERRQQTINRLRIQMESFDQQAKIKELESDRNVNAIVNRMERIGMASLFVGSLIVLIGAYLAIRNYQTRLNTNQIISAQNEEINRQRINDLENNLKIETMHSMINGQEAERERVAKELHDSLGGLLSTVKLHFDAIQGRNDEVSEMREYKKAYNLLDHACNEVRNIANNMQPEALLSMGLVPAINDLVNRVQSEDTPAIDFQHFDVNGNLEPTSALNVYRIVQELLNNAIKHGNASHILIQVEQKDDELMITVEDDGDGYDAAIVKRGMGSGNIESRVNFLKGEINIQSSTGEGTSTLITIPNA